MIVIRRAEQARARGVARQYPKYPKLSFDGYYSMVWSREIIYKANVYRNTEKTCPHSPCIDLWLKTYYYTTE